jgi:DNA uptake protein ComE-like DNA-binding protein
VAGATQSVAVRGWWVLGTLVVPFGLGSGPAFWYASRRAGGVRAWERAGALWFALSLTGYLVALTLKHRFAVPHTAVLVAMFAGWGGAFVHAMVIRPEYVRRAAARVARAQERADAAEARRIVREEPRLAVELGIGRPDRAGAYDAGLVDVNHAPAPALEALPGVGPVLAQRIESAREACDGFASIDDLAALLDLDPATVERMRDRAVFLPR